MADRKLTLPLLAIAVLLGFLQPIDAQTPLGERIDALAQPYIDSEIVVGMTVGVLADDQRVVRGYGQFSADDSRVPDGKTIYEIGSITKVFTGLLLADAVVQGRVTLNTPVNELLPKGVSLNKRGDQETALWHLSTHVSGLPRLPDNLAPKDPNNPYADYGGKELAAFLKSFQPRKRPGEVMLYSNFGAGLLGELLARERKTDYETLVQERIATPLGLKDTRITLDEQQKKRLAAPHDGGGAPNYAWDFDKLAGAGAIRSTVDDMLRFAEAHLDPPKGELGEAIAVAWCAHQKPIAESDFTLCLGWHLARDGETHWHNGGTGGYHSMMLVSRQRNTAVVVLANTSTGEVDRLAQDLALMSAGAPVKPRSFDKPEGGIDVPLEVMRRYEGKYELTPTFVFDVNVRGGRLMVGITDQPTHQVFPKSETEWFYKVVEASLEFEVDGTGKATAVTLVQNGARQKAKRVE